MSVTLDKNHRDGTLKISSYIKKIKQLTIRDIVYSSLIGFIMAVIFVFIFPSRSITTLMHDVLHLPGPGAGIALLVGPFAILTGFIAYLFNPKPGIFLISLFTYSIINPAGQTIFNTQGIGKYPYIILFVSFVVITIFGELILNLIEYKHYTLRYILPSILINIVFLIFWWIIVYPTYDHRWPVNTNISPSKDYMGYISPVPILLVVAIIGSLLISSFYPILYTRIKHFAENKDNSDKKNGGEF